MKTIILSLLLLVTSISFTQNKTNRQQIETTLNNYIDAFYKGDTITLKKAIRPRLNKFGYWKNKESGNYEYYAKMSFDDAMAFVQKMKDQGRSRDENTIRKVEILDIGNHIAVAKVTAAWGIDFMTLSKDDGKWLIEQVIWEGPYEAKTEQKTTTYYLIRHAEKDLTDKSNKNPHLTDVGLKRAEKWVEIFSNVNFDAVYSTDYHRTKETALPTSKSKKLELELYDPRYLDFQKFLENTNGKTVLVVGHSNTTPGFANALLGEKKYDMIKEDNFSNLYIVTVTKDQKTSNLLTID